MCRLVRSQMSIRSLSSVLLSERAWLISIRIIHLPRHYLLSLVDLRLTYGWSRCCASSAGGTAYFPRFLVIRRLRCIIILPSFTTGGVSILHCPHSGPPFGRQFATLFSPSFRGRSIMLTLLRSSAGHPPKHIPRDVHLS